MRPIEFLALTDQFEGLLSNAKLPGVPGIDKFKGHMFHTSRWDYEYTGGSPSDANLSSLEGKTVGIVGKSPCSKVLNQRPNAAFSNCMLCTPHSSGAAAAYSVVRR